MPPVTWGKISVTRMQTGTYQAEARYALFSGRVAKQRARGHSESVARAMPITWRITPRPCVNGQVEVPTGGQLKVPTLR